MMMRMMCFGSSHHCAPGLGSSLYCSHTATARPRRRRAEAGEGGAVLWPRAALPAAGGGGRGWRRGGVAAEGGLALPVAGR